MNKKAQFFLLAAVIISAVIISLGFVANKATTNREPGSFYDFSYEVQRETGAVIDYEIYTLDESEEELELFVNLLADDIRDRDPGSNFVFIYGEGSLLNIRNPGTDSVSVGDQDVPGSGALLISQICSSGTCVPVTNELDDYDLYSGIGTIDVGEAEDFVVTIGDNDYIFPTSPYKQVIFIIQKETEDEKFVSVG